MNAKAAPIPRMDEIESLAGKFAGARYSLAVELETLRDLQEAAKRQRLRFIRAALVKFKAAHADLKDALESNREIFEKPKTRMLHGIKVGFQKQRGKLEIDNDEQVVKLIRKHFPEQFDALVQTIRKPVKPALQNLPAVDLKRLGVRVTDDIDTVVIKPADGEVDKLIDALLNDEELEEVR